ncbi:hypothetical protein BVRB_1g022430 [Beta vulgaris subsp. vulgaris]|nr:hypothetical protein BVRB_1g022430 [Beta vulgaris subsp. vulgaris]
MMRCCCAIVDECCSGVVVPYWVVVVCCSGCWFGVVRSELEVEQVYDVVLD